MQVASSPASAASCAFLSALIASAWPPADVFISPTREVSVTSPLGIVVLSAVVELDSVVVVLDPLLSEVASMFCGCCTPGSVGPIVALAPVLSAVAVLLPSVVVVVLVPVAALASGAGCCTPGSAAPMVALALLSVFAT